MSIPTRHSDASSIVASERTFFITSSTWGKRALLQSERAARLLIDVLLHYRSQSKYLLHEFVVMSNHFHALVSLGSEMTIEKAVQLIKGGFAFRAGRELGFRAPVWQKGFSELRIADGAAFLNAREYIHDNPVKAGLVERPTEYEFSSAHPAFKLDAPPQRLKPHILRARVGIAEAMP